MIRIASILAALALLLPAGAARADAPLTVDDAVRMALARNLDAVEAEAAVRESEASLALQRANLRPRVSGGFGTSWNGARLHDDAGAGTPSAESTTRASSLTPSASASLALWDGAASSSVASARASLDAARLTRVATCIEVAYATRKQFYATLRALQITEVSSASLQVARESEAKVAVRLRVGAVSRGDLLKAEQRTAEAMLDSLSSSQDVVSQSIALARLLGIADTELGSITGSIEHRDRDYDPDSLIREARARRPDLAAAAASVRAAEQALSAARRGNWPKLTASAGADMGTRSASTTETAGLESTRRERGDLAWSGRLSLDLPLIDGGVRAARIRAAAAQLDRARARHQALRDRVSGEVHDALQRYREALVTGVVAERRRLSADEALRLVQRRYEIGSATILELVEAQVDLQQSRSDHVSAVVGLETTAAEIEKAVGREP